MSKAFTSILIILSIIFIYSAKLSRDIQTGHTQKESRIGREEKSTRVSELDFIDEIQGKSFEADILLLERESREQQSSIKNLSKRVDKVTGYIDMANVGIFTDKSSTFEDFKNFVKSEKNEKDINKLQSSQVASKVNLEMLNERLKTQNQGFEETISIPSSSISNLKEDEEEEREQRRKKNRYTKSLDNEEVNMGGNYEIHWNIDEFAEAIQDNRIVKTLYLWQTYLRDGEAEIISEALKINKSITKLDLSGNKIEYKGAKSISEALKINKSITELDLSNNQIRERGAESMSEALKVNQSITNLSLYNCFIGDKGAESISEALKVNKSITILYLSSNFIRDRVLLDKIKNQIKNR